MNLYISSVNGSVRSPKNILGELLLGYSYQFTMLAFVKTIEHILYYLLIFNHVMETEEICKCVERKKPR